MHLQNSIPNQDFPSKQNFSLINHYLFEILKSKGNESPTQSDINAIESDIKKYAVKFSIQSIKFSYYPLLPHGYGRILLVEDQPFYAATHTMLLNNLNFDVDQVWHHFITMRESILSNYDAIFISDNQPNIHVSLIIRYLNQVRKYQLPKLIVIADKTNITPAKKNQFLKQGVTNVLARPLSFKDLFDTMQDLGVLKIN